MKKAEIGFHVILLILAASMTACAPVTYLGIKVLYRKTEWPASKTVRDVCYESNTPCRSQAHTLDLYLPDGNHWPVIVFVHGGGWNEGDKQLRVAGADVYANIGRFYAAHGIGVGVINYRLQPEAKWREQIEDVKNAVAWVHSNIDHYGGNGDQIFLMGHSAGAYLASYVAFTLETDKGRSSIRGVIAASGAALDMADQKTYEMGENPAYYEKRFREGDPTDNWKVVASPISHVTPQAPPFLILYAQGEKKTLQRQSLLLNSALEKKGVKSQVLAIPGESHSRMVLVLSHPRKAAAPAILNFIHTHSAGSPGNP